MPRLVYSNKMSVGGPWLLDSDALQQLDETVAREMSRLMEYREALLDKVVEEEMDDDGKKYPSLRPASEEAALKRRHELRMQRESRYPLSTKLAVTLVDGGAYAAEKFQDAVRDPDLVGKTPVGFDLEVYCGDIYSHVAVERGDDRMRLSASPATSREAKELFVALQQWVARYSAPLWQRAWSNVAGWHWGAYILLVFILILAFVSPQAHTMDAAKQRAKDILDAGITAKNSDKALQLLLELNVGYDPSLTPQPEQVSPPWVRVVIWGGLILSVVMSFKPRVLLGIGQGSAHIRWWRVWLRMLGIVIPGLVLTTIVWPWLVSLFGTLLR